MSEKKRIPRFKTEAEERQFWRTHDSIDYLSCEDATKITLSKLKPSTKTISLRLPESMIEELKILANKQDIQSFQIDDSFARLVFRAAVNETQELRDKLLAHPAIEALSRHQQLMGNTSYPIKDLLDQMLYSIRRDHPSTKVLEFWKQKYSELMLFAEAAIEYLPTHLPSAFSIYLVMGYDIGIASPPDIVLNVGHQHFMQEPQELGYYATHEAHHVGFMRNSPIPPMNELNDPVQLEKLVGYFTQLEGMAVHAVYEIRKEQSALSGDADYLIYTDPDMAQRVVKRYGELVTKIRYSSYVSNDTLGMILTAMSSGERLWYQFGALVAWTIEKKHGRNILVKSIEEKEIFRQIAEELIQKSQKIQAQKHRRQP